MKGLLILFWGLMSCGAMAQSDSIHYEFPLFFEDAVGNKDTVHIGLSEFANDAVNPHLGEINLVDLPFDSVFEVRLAIFEELAGGDRPTYLGKERYLRSEFVNDDPNDCEDIRLFSGVSFVVQSRYPPLTIRWDSASFREGGPLSCLGGTWINNTHAPLVFFDWEELHETDEAYSLACLADSSEEITIMPYNLVPFEDGSSRNYDSNFFQDFTRASVEGSDLELDTLVIYNVWLRYPSDPLCSDLVAAEDLSVPNILANISPNPVNDVLHLELAQVNLSASQLTYTIASTDGRILQSGPVSGASMDIEVGRLPAGLHFFSVTDASRLLGVRRFLKR